MDSLNAAMLVNLVGFTVGIALYGLLAAMVIKHREQETLESINLLLLLTAGLGLTWNLGELTVFVGRSLGVAAGWPFVSAAAYSALGFLPSVVVHSVRIGGQKKHWLTLSAYGLSTFAAVLHFGIALQGFIPPSDFALKTLTFGSLAITAALLVIALRETLQSKMVWASALLIFAVSSLHLSSRSEESSWIVELAAHQSSLPLALVILHQNYRFAFADLFLKRGISLLLISLLAFALYLFVASPFLGAGRIEGRDGILATGLLITLWIATSLVYPSVHQFSRWFVDTIILKRPDYGMVQVDIAKSVEREESIETILELTGDKLAKALTSTGVSRREEIRESSGNAFDLVSSSKNGLSILIPTAELPRYSIDLEGLKGGRRLLSEEAAMLEAVALIASRRIDAVRVVHERCEREFREQEFSRLATEAQLSALRAQVNPHFLFNALTTIGYLIQASPDKAFETLLHLTKLLRGVLNNSAEFCTVADELKMIESYLDIERARFEERLDVEVNVPAEIRNLIIPSLILQPLVENSIKHAISENKDGGKVTISATLIGSEADRSLELCVEDSGSGRPDITFDRNSGVGLRNVRERLSSHYGERSAIFVATGPAKQTIARIVLPVGQNGSPRPA
ncbi:MAG TPA: histidine kinase [Pyrinomonadaceae bacterium]|nr:histidine kinase [Pyrinomonadaceae bacterium]